VVGQASALDPARGDYSTPQTPISIKGPTSKGKGRERVGTGQERGRGSGTPTFGEKVTPVLQSNLSATFEDRIQTAHVHTRKPSLEIVPTKNSTTYQLQQRHAGRYSHARVSSLPSFPAVEP